MNYSIASRIPPGRIQGPRLEDTEHTVHDQRKRLANTELVAEGAPFYGGDAPTWPSDDPRWPQDGPRWPKMAQDGPKMAQDGPKMAQDGPKMGPRWAQDGLKMGRRSVPRGLRRWKSKKGDPGPKMVGPRGQSKVQKK